jgi:hypothetical protein
MDHMIKRSVRTDRPGVEPGQGLGRDQASTRRRPVVAEPLLAAPDGRRWRVLWSREDSRYGGCSEPEPEDVNRRLPAHAAIVMMPAPADVDEHRDLPGAL